MARQNEYPLRTITPVFARSTTRLENDGARPQVDRGAGVVRSLDCRIVQRRGDQATGQIYDEETIVRVA